MIEDFKEKDEELCEKYSIIRPSYNEDNFKDLRICIDEKLKTRDWKEEWITDETLIRFLKAFQNVEDTMAGIEDYCEWRIKENVDVTGALILEEDEDLKREKALGRDVTFENFFDRCGRPIMLVTVANHDRHHGNYPSLFKYIIWLLECISKMTDQKSQDHKLSIIFNLNGFGMRNMDFKYVKSFLTMLRYYYPERIAQCFIINYPWIFLGCWSIIKHWMNDVTRSKFIFAEYEQLNDFIDLEKMPASVF